jgi:hypothetical protein
MWESSKNSGVLIGIDPRTLSMLSSIYNSFQKDFGYSEKDYHKALITPGYYQQYSSTLKVADATVILEQSLSIKKLYIVDKRYEEVISHLDQKIGDK